MSPEQVNKIGKQARVFTKWPASKNREAGNGVSHRSRSACTLVYTHYIVFAQFLQCDA